MKRADSARWAHDYGKNKVLEPRQWNTFSVGDVDHRHEFGFADIPPWDDSPAAESARAFLVWKFNNPDIYAQMNNVTGDAEMWFYENEGNVRHVPSIAGPGMIGLSIFLLGLAGAVIGLSVSWVITELMTNHWGWNIHWAVEGFGMILGLIGIGAAFLSLLGLGILILFSPLIALSLLVRGIKNLFKPKSERDADKQMSQVLKEDKQLRKLYKKKGRSKSGSKSMKSA